MYDFISITVWNINISVYILIIYVCVNKFYMLFFFHRCQIRTNSPIYIWMKFNNNKKKKKKIRFIQHNKWHVSLL